MSGGSITDELCAGDLMSRTFVTVAPEDTLGELAERLAKADAGSALVFEVGQLTGILTSRDIVRAVAGRVHPSAARVREWAPDGLLDTVDLIEGLRREAECLPHP